MSGVHRHLLVHRDGPSHRLAPQCKLLATVLFVFAVVATPKEQFWAFGVHGGLVVTAALIGRVPLRHVARRLVIEVPFLLFALLLPVFGRGPRVDVLGVSLSQPGLWAAWNIVVKGTIGVAATVVMASTTPIPLILHGLERLRVPRTLVAITAFMVRYGDVITDELRRMRIARESRGCPGELDGPGSGRGHLGRRPVRALLRAGRAGVPGDGLSRLRRFAAGAQRGGDPRGVGDVPGVAGGGDARRPRGLVGAGVTTPVLEVRDLAFTYPDGREALRGVDLTVTAGERVGILGPNGAGKTTLVLALNGINTATRGTVRVAGTPIERRSLPEIRRRVGIVFQDPDDQLFMPTVHDDVAFGPANLGVRGAELAARTAEALEDVGMSHVADRAPHHLSFGERRRVALATVLAMRPDVLVLDEPSSNLDPSARRELAEIVLGLPVTILLVTHDLPYALQLCTRSVVLNGGRVVVDGPTRDVLADRDTMAANRLELPYGFDPLTT